MGAGVEKGIGENMFNAAEDDIIIFTNYCKVGLT